MIKMFLSHIVQTKQILMKIQKMMEEGFLSHIVQTKPAQAEAIVAVDLVSIPHSSDKTRHPALVELLREMVSIPHSSDKTGWCYDYAIEITFLSHIVQTKPTSNLEVLDFDNYMFLSHIVQTKLEMIFSPASVVDRSFYPT